MRGLWCHSFQCLAGLFGFQSVGMRLLLCGYRLLGKITSHANGMTSRLISRTVCTITLHREFCAEPREDIMMVTILRLQMVLRLDMGAWTRGSNMMEEFD